MKENENYDEIDREDLPRQNNNRSSLSGLKKYIITVVSIVGVFIIMFGALIWAYSVTSGNTLQKKPSDDSSSAIDTNADKPNNAQTIATEVPKKADDIKTDDAFKLKRKTNFLIIGTDQSGYLADVQVVISYDNVTGNVNLLSIPRDTKIKLPENLIREIESPYMPSSGVMKINELHSYAGQEEGHKYLQLYLQQILGVDIDYYAKISLTAFKKIVDAIGGVWFDVRSEGYYYKDEYQDPPLIISVPGGYQLLDGEQAEGVVRYRHDYSLGDLDRIPVQQEFMLEFFKQALDKKSIADNVGEYFTTFSEYVKTDFGMSDLILYADAFSHLNTEKFHTYTLPGESENFQPYYFIYDPTETMNLIAKTFNDYSDPDSSIAVQQ